MTGTSASVFCDHPCHLGEGPLTHPGLDRVFWFDIKESHLLERPIAGGATRIRSLPFSASAAAIIDDARLALVTERGLYAYELDTERMSLIVEVEPDNPVTRANDSRVHPSGALWFGTMGNEAEPGAGSIWWLYRGQKKQLFSGLSVVNSIAFSPDGAIGYFADSAERVIWRIALDPSNGLPSGQRDVFVTFDHVEGDPDGSIVDADGCLWNARWGGSCVDVYTRDGRRIATHHLPVRQPTCPAFVNGGLIVTSAYEGFDAVQRAADPLAGATFFLPLEIHPLFDPPIAL